MTARELLLIVRAQNQASGALRRVASDMRGLKAATALRMQGQELQNARQTLMRQRQIAANELESITRGKRYIGLQRDKQAAEIAMQNALLTRSGVEQSMRRNQESMLRNEVQRARLTRQLARPDLSLARRADLGKLYNAAAIAAQRLSMEEGRLGSRAANAAASVEKQQVAIRALGAREAEAARRAEVLRSRLSGLGSSLAVNAQKIEANNTALKNLKWDRLAAGGRIMQHTARIAQYAGLILGGSLAFMAHSAAQFQTNVTYAATQTRSLGGSFKETATNSKYLQGVILGLMKQFPAAADDISAAAYDIYSSTDVNLKRGAKALKLFTQAAVAGQTDVKTATDAGIVVLNNFGNNVDLLPRRLQRMFAAVRFGRMTFADFASSMSTIGPAARAANQSFDEMAGTFAFLTRHLSVGFARVGFARVLEALTQPKMLEGLKKAGVTITDAHDKLIPLHEIIGKLIQRFPYLEKGGVRAMNFFKEIGGLKGTIQARRAFTFMTQFFKNAAKDGASYSDMLTKVSTDNDEFTKSLQAMQKTTGVRWGVFINQLKALALELGANVIPALIAMGQPLLRLSKWFSGLDDSTKRTIARFATFAAGITILGSAALFVGGTFVRLFAVFAAAMGPMSGLLVIVGSIAAAVELLSGHWRDLNDVINTFVSFGTGSAMGWVTMLTLAAVAALKLRGALMGVVAAEGAGAGGGLLAGLFGRGRNVRAGMSLTREAMASKGAIAGLAASAALIPGSFLLAAGAIATVTAGALLWKRHMDAIKARAEETARILKSARVAATTPRREADVFQGITGSIDTYLRARVSLRELRREISDTRKELTTATGRRRLELIDQLQTQLLDAANASNTVSDSIQKMNTQFDAAGRSVQTFNAQAVQIRQVGRQIGIMQRLMDEFGRRGIGDPLARVSDLGNAFVKMGRAVGIDANTSLETLGRVLDRTRNKLRIMVNDLQVSGRSMTTAFTGVIKTLNQMGQLSVTGMPIKIPHGAVQDMINTMKRLGRSLTIPEMRAIIKAELDPNARTRLPAAVRKIFAGVRAQRVKVEIDAKQVAAQNKKLKAAGQYFPLIKITDVGSVAMSAKKAHSATAKVFTPITQAIHIGKPQPDPVSIGRQIHEGIMQGLGGPVDVTITKHVNTIMTTYQKTIKSGSPSRLFAETVGKPIAQGIMMGILSEAGLITKTAQITLTLFSGAILSALDSKKKPTAAQLTKDLQSQVKAFQEFNQALARLRRRKVPKGLIDDLAALGPEAAANIDKISHMSGPALHRYVMLWKKAQAEIKKSMRVTQADWKTAMASLADQAASNLANLFSQFHDTSAQQFGELFGGPLNLSSMVGDNFKQAMDDYNSQISDFQGQIKDLNQQLVDAQNEAAQRLIDAVNQRRDELQQAMGGLFGGDWLQGPEVQTKIDWGQKLGFDDLFKDLQGQVEKFKRWRQDLINIAKRIPPALAQELEKLGPEAVDKIETLNSATDDQLKQYVDTWQQGQDAIMAVASQTTVDTSDIAAKVQDILKQIDDITAKMAAIQAPHQLTGQDIINDLNAQIATWQDYQGTLQALIDKGIPAALVQQLQNMGPQALPYLKALVAMTGPQLDEFVKAWQTSQDLINQNSVDMLNTQLKLWFEFGQKAALEMIAGVSSESDKLIKFFKDLFADMLKGGDFTIPPIAPPPPIGNIPGAVRGRDDTITPPASTGNRSLQSVNIEVNAVQDESLQTTLERAAFRIINRTPG